MKTIQFATAQKIDAKVFFAREDDKFFPAHKLKLFFSFLYRQKILFYVSFIVDNFCLFLILNANYPSSFLMVILSARIFFGI
jgi:hypothetical protein